MQDKGKSFSDTASEADSEDKEKKQGLSVIIAATFLASCTAGTGVLVLPQALSRTGWSGLALMALACFNSGYSAVLLGKCWCIMEENWPEYRQKIRYPYPAIGERACGKWMRILVSIFLQLTVLGICVVYILLCAQLLQSLIPWNVSYYVWILIVGGCMCPLTWFGTPNDFWLTSLIALGTVAVACALLLAGILTKKQETEPLHSDPTFYNYFLAFGTVVFTFGGVFFFPTIHNDMKNKDNFPLATILAYAAVVILYIPVSVSGYVVYGDKIESNILMSLNRGVVRQIVEVSLSGHLFFELLFIINPLVQEVEELFRVPHNFNWKRCIVRTAALGLAIIIALFIPHFDKVLDLIGALFFPVLTFILPPVLYICLRRQTWNKFKERTMIELSEKLIIGEIIIIGVIGGIASTYSAINDIVEVFRNPGNDTSLAF